MIAPPRTYRPPAADIGDCHVFLAGRKWKLDTCTVNFHIHTFYWKDVSKYKTYGKWDYTRVKNAEERDHVFDWLIWLYVDGKDLSSSKKKTLQLKSFESKDSCEAFCGKELKEALKDSRGKENIRQYKKYDAPGCPHSIDLDPYKPTGEQHQQPADPNRFHGWGLRKKR